jgi:peptide chain release factor 1
MQFTLHDSDLKTEWYSGTGCGGQNRNKVQSSCRLTHIPTGITQTAQTRSRTSSYTLAYSKLSEEVIKLAQAKHSGSVAALRKDQVGTGMRGDKTRTYRFQDDIVTDHTSGKRSSVKKVLSGNFDLLW